MRNGKRRYRAREEKVLVRAQVRRRGSLQWAVPLAALRSAPVDVSRYRVDTRQHALFVAESRSLVENSHRNADHALVLRRPPTHASRLSDAPTLLTRVMGLSQLMFKHVSMPRSMFAHIAAPRQRRHDK